MYRRTYIQTHVQTPGEYIANSALLSWLGPELGNKVVRNILTPVTSCLSAVKVDPQNLLNYITLHHTKFYKIHQINLFSTYRSLKGLCQKSRVDLFQQFLFHLKLGTLLNFEPLRKIYFAQNQLSLIQSNQTLQNLNLSILKSKYSNKFLCVEFYLFLH